MTKNSRKQLFNYYRITALFVTLLLLLPALALDIGAPAHDIQDGISARIENSDSLQDSRSVENMHNFTDFSEGTFTNTLVNTNDQISLGWESPKQQYQNDGNTYLLSHFENSFIGEDGEEAVYYSRNPNGLVGCWGLDEEEDKLNSLNF